MNQLSTSYQTTPLGLVTIKALRNRNIMLFLITFVSLLNELLVVGVGGMSKYPQPPQTFLLIP